MSYRITRSIDISFSHHIRGHLGPCINLHGHTWKLEVTLEASELDRNGFVIDFSDLSSKLLRPCHALLDHALAVGDATYEEVESDLASMGKTLLESRNLSHEKPTVARAESVELAGARNAFPGGMKVAIFPFNPTSERFSKWLYDAASEMLADDRVRVSKATIYETLHPVESYATYSP